MHQNNDRKMKNTTIFLVIVILIAVGGYFIFAKSQPVSSVTGNMVKADNLQEIQKLVLSEKDLNYYPQEVSVKVNQPVSLSLDEKVKGCLRSITIRDLGVVKYLKTTQDTVEFTPTKKGTYTIACSMGMGSGKLVVE